MKNFKVLAAVTSLLIFFTVFFGCKKSEIKPTVAQPDSQAQLREFYRQKLKGQPVVTKQVLNQKGKGYYSDLNGNRITVTPGQPRGQASTCPDPGDSEVEYSFVSMEREYTCGVGYRFLVTFQVISEFYILYDNGSNISSGKVRLKNGSTTLLTTSPAALLNIQNNGVVGLNGNGDDLNEFEITFRTPIVDETTYNSSNAIQPSLFAYTDCANYPTITIPFNNQVSSDGSQHLTMPCLRIDLVAWNPSSGTPPSYTPPSLSGADPTGWGCFPWGYVYPHRQQIQFLNGSSQWKPFYLYLNGLANPSTEEDLILYTDVWYIDVSTSQSANGLSPGNVQVRYRNNLMGTSSNGGPCVTQPDDTWIYETWYIN